MKKYKTIKFSLLLIYSLAKDFDNKLTWKKLYDKLYIKNTNIYNANVLTLKHWGIKINDKIIEKQIKKIVQKNIVIFKINLNNDPAIIVDITNDKEYEPEGIDTNDCFAKLGYTSNIK